MMQVNSRPEHTDIDIIYADPNSLGYHPLTYMGLLAAELFDARYLSILPRPLTTFTKVAAVLPRSNGAACGIMICPSPSALQAILQIQEWRQRYRKLVAWVFDSFWTERIPWFARLGHIFDHVFIAEREDLQAWRRIMRMPVDYLPWGSDALRMGSANLQREVDLVRLGRQPEGWDNDESTLKACAKIGLKFQGRPPGFDDPITGQRELMKKLSHTKFTLSFSNRVSPGIQTHPKREYITARWTDALSCGASVIGVPPACPSIKATFWKGALIDPGTIDLDEGLRVVYEAVMRWKPQDALFNHYKSLQLFDWRWRFQKLAAVLDISPVKLCNEIALVTTKIEDCRRRLEVGKIAV